MSHSENCMDGESHIQSYEQTYESVQDEITEQKSDECSVNSEGPAPGQMSREEIEESLSQIVDGIKEKRKQDMKIMEDVIKEIMAQAKRSCEILEQQMLHMHTMKSKELDDELEKLLSVLDNIKQAEIGLETSKTSLHTLCQEIQKSI